MLRLADTGGFMHKQTLYLVLIFLSIIGMSAFAGSAILELVTQGSTSYGLAGVVSVLVYILLLRLYWKS